MEGTILNSLAVVDFELRPSFTLKPQAHVSEDAVDDHTAYKEGTELPALLNPASTAALF